VVPKPLERPPSPPWVAARDPDTYDCTVRHGLGVIATTLSKPDSEVENLAGRLANALADHSGAHHPAFMLLRRPVCTRT